MLRIARHIVAAVGFVLAVGSASLPAFAHGNTVKITDDSNAKSYEPQYREVTVNADNTLSFWGTTVKHGTIVFADGLGGQYHDYSAIPVNRSNAGFHDGAAAFKYSNVGASAPAPSAPKYTYHYIGGATTFLGSAAVRDDRGNVYVFPPAAATLLSKGKGFAVGNESFVISNDGGSIVAAGGGNIVAAGGGNIVAAGGGNIVAAGGGNLASAAIAAIVAAGGGNLISNDGGGLIGNDGGGLISQGGAPMMMDGASFIGSGTSFRIMSFKDSSGKTDRSVPTAMKQCSDARISYAYVIAASKTGNSNISLHGDSGAAGRCNPASYAGGQYTPNNLEALVQHSYDCADQPEVGQALFLDGYTPQAFTGCNAQHYYTNGQKWTNFSDLRSRVTAYARAFANGTENATKDKYGCVSPSLPVAVFTAQKLFFRNYDSVTNLNKSLANSFTCSDKLVNTTIAAYQGLYLGDPNNIPVALQLRPVVVAPAAGTAAAPADPSTAFDRPETAAAFCRVNNFGDVVRRDSITTSQLYGKPNYYTYYLTSGQSTYAPSQGSGSYYCMAFAQEKNWKASPGTQSSVSPTLGAPPSASTSAYTVNRLGSGYYVIAGKEAWLFSPSQAVVSQEKNSFGIPNYFTIGSGRFDLALNLSSGNATISHNSAPITALGQGSFDGNTIPSNNVLTGPGTVPFTTIAQILTASGSRAVAAVPAPVFVATPSPPVAVTKDKYGCTPGNYPVAIFSSPQLNLPNPLFFGNYADVSNLDQSKANSFTCSNQLPPGMYRGQPDNIPVVLQLRPPVAPVATPAPGAPPANPGTAFDSPDAAAAFCTANSFGAVLRRDSNTTSKLYGKPNFNTYFVRPGQPGFAPSDPTGSGPYYCTKFVQDKGWKESPQPRP